MRLSSDRRLIDLALSAPANMAEWYERAHASILDFSAACQIDSYHVANVTAILSPRLQVARNAKLAVQYLTTDDTTGIMKGRISAIENYVRTGAVAMTGQKVRNFAANLNGDLSRVTVDVWACRSFGVDYEGPDSPAKSDAVYATMAGRYTRLANRFGISPAGFQAMVWFGIRAEYGILDKEADLDLLGAARGFTYA